MDYPSVQILGIRFCNGDVDEVLTEISRHGGTIVVPAAPALTKLRDENEQYQLALASADLAIADSGAMVLLWRLFRGQRLTRISGLKYLQHWCAKFLTDQGVRVLWAVPNESAREKTAAWLTGHRVTFNPEDLYVAPFYQAVVEDGPLLERLEIGRHQHVVIAIGNGPQEKLGYYLRENLSYRPAIHCIGAALGFLTGDQVAIPDWADRLYLGWLFRLVAQPRIFIPRLTRALKLPWLIARYGSELPALREQGQKTEST